MVSETLNRFTSIYFNGSDTYRGRYTLSASARKDAANVYGVNANQKGTPLYSLGGGWKISNEPFYHVKAISFLNLRATFGYSGINPAAFALPIISYSSVGSYFTNLPYANVSSPANPNLIWEKVSQINLAVDFSSFKQIISGSFEYYRKHSTNLIGPAPLDPTTGFSSIDENSANIKGDGVDLQLNTKNIQGRVSWETNLIISYNKSKVTKYIGYSYNSNAPIASDYVGAAQGIAPKNGIILESVYAYKWEGLDPATGDPQGYYQGKVSKDYEDIMNDSIRNLVYKGSAIPLYFGSIRNAFGYKGFSLSANIAFRFAYWFQRPTISYSAFYQGLEGATSSGANIDFDKRWQKPGDEKLTTVPSMNYPADQTRDMFYANAEPNFLKGDNVKLQDIRLAYQLDNKIRRFGFSRIEVYGYVRDLGVLWRANREHLDPDYLGIPPAKTFSFGIKGVF